MIKHIDFRLANLLTGTVISRADKTSQDVILHQICFSKQRSSFYKHGHYQIIAVRMVDLGNTSGTWSDPGPGAAYYSSGVGSDPERELEFSLPEMTPRDDDSPPARTRVSADDFEKKQSDIPYSSGKGSYLEESLDRDADEVDLTFKILVLGDSSVGKTCLIWRFCENSFIEDGQTTTTVGRYRLYQSFKVTKK